MKTYIKIIVSLFVLFTVSSANFVVAKEPALAPDFKLQDIYQDIYTLSSYKDKQPIILFFWTTWCPLCAKELRILNQMYAGLTEDGAEVLAINIGELPDRVSNFVRDYHLAYRVLLDKDTTVAFSYGLIGVPTYVFIDKKGYIRFKDNYFSRVKYKDLF